MKVVKVDELVGVNGHIEFWLFGNKVDFNINFNYYKINNDVIIEISNDDFDLAKEIFEENLKKGREIYFAVDYIVNNQKHGVYVFFEEDRKVYRIDDERVLGGLINYFMVRGVL